MSQFVRPGIVFPWDVIRGNATALTMKEENQFHQQCSRVRRFLGREVEQAEDVSWVVAANRETNSSQKLALLGHQMLAEK